MLYPFFEASGWMPLHRFSLHYRETERLTKDEAEKKVCKVDYEARKCKSEPQKNDKREESMSDVFIQLSASFSVLQQKEC